MRSRSLSYYSLSGAFFAAIGLLVLILLSSHASAGGGGPPFPGTPALDNPTVIDDIVSPVCVPPVCGLNIYAGPYMFTSGGTPATNFPCLNGTFGGFAASAASAITHIGCRDDRYKNIKILGPQQLQHPCLTPQTILGQTVCLTLYPVDLILLDKVGGIDGTAGAMANATDNPNGMPHKDTPATALVNLYPWLYEETDEQANNISVRFNVYRGYGNNKYIDFSRDIQVAAAQQQAAPSIDSFNGSSEATYNNTQFFEAIKAFCQIPTDSCASGAGSGSANPDNGNFQYWTRLVLDSCTNQYILPSGLQPEYVMNSQYYADGMPWNEAYCQPLVSTPVPCKYDLINDHSGGTCLTDNAEGIMDNNLVGCGSGPGCGNTLPRDLYVQYSGVHAMYDYRAWGYLEKAWIDVLATPYSPSSGSNHNALIVGSGVGMISLPTPMVDYYFYGQVNGSSGTASFNYTDPGTAPVQYTKTGNQNCTGGGPPNCPTTYASNADWQTPGFLLININELSQRPYERIFDTTHPFTPRWDMKFKTGTTPAQDRDLANSTMIYYPAGIPIPYNGYSAIPVTSVTCPVRCASTPVDIMMFRAAEFNACMTCRITKNTNCFWNEVLLNDVAYYTEATADSISPYNGCCPPVTVYAQALADTIAGKSLDYGTLFSDTIFGIHVDPLYWLADFDFGFATSEGDDMRCKSRLVAATKDSYNPWSVSGQWPPCATTYMFPFDNAPAFCTDCLKMANDYSDDTSTTYPNTTSNSKSGSTKSYRLSSVTKCCNDLAQPIAPVNLLKIRNVQDDPGLKDGSGHLAAGYSYSGYFSDGNFPYMRWWDTGTSAGGTAGNPVSAAAGGVSGVTGVNPMWYDPLLGTNYDPNCDKGKDDVIVGVGSESTGTGSPAGLCRFGGAPDPTSGTPPTKSMGYTCMNIGYPDRLTTWEELKQYQLNAERNYGLECLPAQEKILKWGGAEEGPLFQAGRHWSSKMPLTFDTTNTLYQFKTNPWPLRWRGFLTDSRATVTSVTGSYPYRFPNFDPGNSTGAPPAGSLFTGLDYAQPGDIIYLLPTDADANLPSGTQVASTAMNSTATTFAVMPFMAVVTSVHHNSANATANCNGNTECTDIKATCSDHVTVVDVNNGKYPDACGTTDYIGMGQTRTIYKEWVPINVLNVLFPGPSAGTVSDNCGDSHTIPSGGNELTFSAEGNCMDPKYAVCTFANGLGDASDNGNGAWSNIHVYRPTLDERGATTR